MDLCLSIKKPVCVRASLLYSIYIESPFISDLMGCPVDLVGLQPHSRGKKPTSLPESDNMVAVVVVGYYALPLDSSERGLLKSVLH